MRAVGVLILICTSVLTFAQKPIPALERPVNLSVNNTSISVVLEKISAQTGIKFSYNPSTVKVDRKISISVTRKPVRSVLNLLFDETIQIKQNGNYIILTYKAVKVSSKQEPTKTILLTGYVYSRNGQTLDAASIYNTSNLLATVSNAYGYYQLQIPASNLPITLKVSKEFYDDTTLRVDNRKTSNDIVLNHHPPALTETAHIETKTEGDTLTPIDTTTATTHDTIDPKPIGTFLQNLVLSNSLKSSIRNIKDTVFRTTQFSLIPYVSTNKLLSGNTVNDYSFNILIGYSQGVNKLELGGLMNIDRGDVKFFQAAGILNAVEGSVTGAQLAGIGNITKGKSEGVVAAGIFNIGTHLRGVQLAGITNVNLSYPDSFKNVRVSDFFEDTISGIQIAGTANVNAGYFDGIRIAGTVNLGQQNKGMQISGLMNGNWGKSKGMNLTLGLNYMNDTSIGFNIAGMANINRNYVNGFQIAGLTNITLGDAKMQITSLLNIAKNVPGTQIALVNISDSTTGIPIGLMSYVHSGYHRLELFGDDVIYAQLAFRTGVPVFHNILNIGVDLTRKNNGLWNFGYGIGSTLKLSSKWSLTTDLLAQVILQKADIENAPLLGNLFVGIERIFSNRYSIAFGPVYHGLITFGTQNNYTQIASDLIPYSLSTEVFDNGNQLNTWIGGKVSFKFL